MNRLSHSFCSCDVGMIVCFELEQSLCGLVQAFKSDIPRKLWYQTMLEQVHLSACLFVCFCFVLLPINQ